MFDVILIIGTVCVYQVLGWMMNPSSVKILTQNNNKIVLNTRKHYFNLGKYIFIMQIRKILFIGQHILIL